MIVRDAAVVEEVVIHRVCVDEGDTLSMDASLTPDNPEEWLFFRDLLLKPYSNAAFTFEFDEMSGNSFYRLLLEWQSGAIDFYTLSKDLAELFSSFYADKDPNPGEFVVAKIEDVDKEGVLYKALCIAKYETKTLFLETRREEGKIDSFFRFGLGEEKPEVSVLILLDQEPFTVIVVDNKQRSEFWRNGYLGIQTKKDTVNQTHNFLNLTKRFIMDDIPDKFEVSKADQIDLLNRSVQYFKENEVFERESFENEVFQNEQVIDNFRKFDEVFNAEQEVVAAASFEIAKAAVKKQARDFKSVLKLDKNFHIYIHGNRQLIEKGVDEDGRKFYRIYFENEE
jgi:hypothetical protein